MRQFRPLHPRHILHYAAILFILFTFASCTSTSEIRASIDGSNEHEGGASALSYDQNVGTNVAWCILLGKPSSVRNSVDFDNEFASEKSSPIAYSGQLEFVQKGSKFQSTTTTLNYLNAIGDVLYQYPMQNNAVLYGGLGPYIGYGIGGHVKTGDTKQSAFGSDGYKRFDAGLHITAGYRLPVGLSFNLAYEFGLANKSRFDDFTSKNRTYSFQLGYSIEKIINVFKKK